MFASTTPTAPLQTSVCPCSHTKEACQHHGQLGGSELASPAERSTHTDYPREPNSLWPGSAHVVVSQGVSRPQLGKGQVAQARSHFCRDAWSQSSCLIQILMATDHSLSSNRGSLCQCSATALQSKYSLRVTPLQQSSTEILHIYPRGEMKRQDPWVAACDTGIEDACGTLYAPEFVRLENEFLGRELPWSRAAFPHLCSVFAFPPVGIMDREFQEQPPAFSMLGVSWELSLNPCLISFQRDQYSLFSSKI